MVNTMRRNKKYFKAVLLSFFCLFLVCHILFMIPLTGAAEPAGKFTSVEGKVDVLREGAAPAVVARVPDSLFPKDIVRTKSNSKAEIIMKDNTVLRIGQRSRIDISEYVIDEKNNMSSIKLQRGQVKAVVDKNVSKRIALAPGANRFEIQTPNAVAGVRGTEFFVAYEQNTTTVLLKEGEVCVHNLKDSENVVCLPPSYIVTITGAMIPQQPRKATETEMRIFETSTAPGAPFSRTFPENILADKPGISDSEPLSRQRQHPDFISLADTPTNITDMPLTQPITDLIPTEPEPEPGHDRFRSIFGTNIWSLYPSKSDGSISAAMFGNTSPWSATFGNVSAAQITGAWLTNSSLPHIWFENNVYSYNSRNSSNTTLDGGAYRGFLSGKEISGSADARFNGLYIDPSGNIGFMRGGFVGTTGNNTISLNGGLYTVQMGTGSMSAADFYTSIITNSFNTSGSGSFSTEAAITGSGVYNSMNINGQDNWGVSQMVTGGSYADTAGSSWTFTATGSYGAGHQFEADITGTQWSSSRIAGSAAGYWTDARTAAPSTGIFIGETTGTFNPADHTWQAITTGTWLDTRKFLQMASDANGRSKLQQLNIPAFEVGRTDLSGSLIAGSGSSLDYISVMMNDVAFFAPSTGGKPSIWATDDITGQYSFSNGFLNSGNITNAENAFTLSNGDSISADFRFTQWNTSNNTWSANLTNGTGTLSGGSYNGQVSFRGGAAGIFNGTNSGSLSGTGAGIVR